METETLSIDAKKKFIFHNYAKLTSKDDQCSILQIFITNGDEKKIIETVARVGCCVNLDNVSKKSIQQVYDFIEKRITEINRNVNLK